MLNQYKVKFSDNDFSPAQERRTLLTDSPSLSAKSSSSYLPLPTYKQYRYGALSKGLGAGLLTGIILFLTLLSVILVRFEENDRDAERAFDQYNIFHAQLKDWSFADRTALAFTIYFIVIALVSMITGMLLGRCMQLRRESDRIVRVDQFDSDQIGLEKQAQDSLRLLKQLKRDGQMQRVNEAARTAALTVLAYHQVFGEGQETFPIEVRRFIQINQSFFTEASTSGQHRLLTF